MNRFSPALHLVALICAACLITAPGEARQNGGATLNFRNAEIQAFIEDISELTGYTFVTDPQLRGVVNIASQGPLTREEIFQVFQATLRVHGYVAVPTGPGVYQIRPEREGARSGAPMVRDEASGFVTAVVRLNAASAREAVRTLASMNSAAGTLTALESGNAVVIVDFASNVSAIRDALSALDRDNTLVELVALENVSAGDMAQVVDRLRAPAFQGEDNRRLALIAAPIPASNTLLLRGEAGAVREMMALIRRVDAASRSNQSFRAITLSHADGAGLLPILEQVSARLGPADAQGQGARRAAIAHHPATNTLVLNADPDHLRELELVIRQLDIRRPQVLVEAIIVEMSDQAARDLGVQLLLSGNQDSAVPFFATRYGAPDILAIAGALAARGDDAVSENLRQGAATSLLGSRGGLAGVGGQNSAGTTFGLILNALEQDGESNILSKPSIVTLDNEEASIIVGQQIPITTGEVLGSANSNPFRTIERQDVGVQLRVRPQISDGDTIRLYLRQEVSSVAGPVSANFAELITNNRAIETTVLADDGQIIVLGGLLERDEQTSQSRVPVLGSIPVVGRAFRSESRSGRRTNLVVFIRPVIVRSPQDMRDLALRAYADMNEGGSGRPSAGLDELAALLRDAPAPRPLPAPEQPGRE